MIVIVPHRDLELKLIKSQKEIIRQLAEKEADKIFYASIPLWIKTDFESVEQAKKQIKSVTVLEPQYDDEGIFCPVEIESVSGDVFESKLDFIRHCEERSDVAIQTYDVNP